MISRIKAGECKWSVGLNMKCQRVATYSQCLSEEPDGRVVIQTKSGIKIITSPDGEWFNTKKECVDFINGIA